MRNAKLVILPIFSVITTFSSSVIACLVPEPLDFDYIENADAIFIGHVSKYVVVPRNPVARTPSYSWVTFEVENYVLGESKEGDVDAFWQDYSGIPEALVQGRYLVAVKTVELPSTVLAKIPSSGSAASEKYRILQDPCRPAFILEASQENVDKANRFLEKKDTRDAESMESDSNGAKLRGKSEFL